MNLDEKKKFIINFIYFSIWATIFFLTFKLALVYLFPFFIGIIIAYLVQKPSIYVSKKLKIRKETCAAYLSAIFFVFVIAILILSLWGLYTQLADLFDYMGDKMSGFNEFYTNVVNSFKKIFNLEKVTSSSTAKKFFNNMADTIVKKAGAFISEIVTDIIKKLPTFFISSVITIVATCYISKDYERLKKFLNGILGERRFKNVVEIKCILKDCVFKISVGYFWIFLITFAQLLLGFLILGVKKYFIIAILVAVFDLLPVIGTGTILLPWSVILFIQNDYTKAVGMVILYIVTIIIRNFTEPKIIGKQIKINPLFMLVFIFLGLKIGGAAGMIVFPLVFTVLFTYFRNKIIVKNSYNE